MDPIGFVISVAGLIGVFTACVDAFELVQLARHRNKDYSVFQTKLDNQRFRLSTWGEACGLLDEQNHDLCLDNPELRSRVAQTLQVILDLLKDGNELKSRYGLKPQGPAQTFTGYLTLSSTTPLRPYAPIIARFKAKLRKTQMQPGSGSSIRWAIEDRNKFDTLIQHLRDLLDDLERMTQSSRVTERKRIIVEYEISSLSDTESLNLIEQVNASTDDTLSETVSQRRVALRGGTQSIASRLDTLSIQSSYYTAPIKPSVLEPPPRSLFPSVVPDEPANQLPPPPVIDLGQPGRYPDSAYEEHCLRRLRGEKLRWAKDPVDDIDYEILNNKLYTLMAWFRGPTQTPYEGGTFYLQFIFPPEYPLRPPFCRFITKVYHPNVDPHGRICCDMLQDAWSITFSTEKILLSLSSLLASPEFDDPYVPEISELYFKDPKQFEENARLYTMKYATLPKPNLNGLETPSV